MAKIRLRYKAPDGRTDLFVKSTVRNSSDIELTNSPFSLNHVGGGVYTNNSEDYPDGEPSVHASHVVFKEAGFVNLNRRYAEDFQTITDENLLEEIKNQIAGGVGGGGDLGLVGELEDDGEVTGEVSEAHG